MGLAHISLRNFRCFVTADLDFDPNLNLITGKNASGKTSLIEAVYLLGRGRSFRTANLGSAIRSDAHEFQIHGRISNAASQLPVTLVHKDRQLQARISGKAPENLARLSENFPIQLVDSQAHQLIRGGPRCRRQFLDWGVFHVEPAFFPSWRRYQRALQQRNALLRAGETRREIVGWDGELASYGEALDHMRRDYLESLIPTASEWSGYALGGADVQLDYQPGWPQELSLSAALQGAIDRDYGSSTTRFGPHRADVRITINGKLAQEWLSKGQEKALAGSLLLAQAAVYRSLTGRTCTLLLDDLPSELDTLHQQRFMERIMETGAQTLITAIEAGPSLVGKAAKLFHVEQGKIT